MILRVNDLVDGHERERRKRKLSRPRRVNHATRRSNARLASSITGAAQKACCRSWSTGRATPARSRTRRIANSLVRVPFRILTEEEEKLLSMNYNDISKQVKDAFKKK